MRRVPFAREGERAVVGALHAYHQAAHAQQREAVQLAVAVAFDVADGGEHGDGLHFDKAVAHGQRPVFEVAKSHLEGVASGEPQAARGGDDGFQFVEVAAEALERNHAEPLLFVQGAKRTAAPCATARGFDDGRPTFEGWTPGASGEFHKPSLLIANGRGVDSFPRCARRSCRSRDRGPRGCGIGRSATSPPRERCRIRARWKGTSRF